MGYGYQPEALGAAIRRAVEVTGLPVYVTENGVGTDDDTRRVEFIERALRGVEACLRDGLDVRGYIYWSLFDNFEWASATARRSGSWPSTARRRCARSSRARACSVRSRARTALSPARLTRRSGAVSRR